MKTHYVTAEEELPGKFENGSHIGAVELLRSEKDELGYTSNMSLCFIWIEDQNKDRYVIVHVYDRDRKEQKYDWVREALVPGIKETIELPNHRIRLALFENKLEGLGLANTAIKEKAWLNNNGPLKGSQFK